MTLPVAGSIALSTPPGDVGFVAVFVSRRARAFFVFATVISELAPD